MVLRPRNYHPPEHPFSQKQHQSRTDEQGHTDRSNGDVSNPGRQPNFSFTKQNTASYEPATVLVILACVKNPSQDEQRIQKGSAPEGQHKKEFHLHTVLPETRETSPARNH